MPVTVGMLVAMRMLVSVRIPLRLGVRGVVGMGVARFVRVTVTA